MSARERIRDKLQIGGIELIPPLKALFEYRLDGLDSSLVPINTPIYENGWAEPDCKHAEFNGVDMRFDASEDSNKVAIGTGPFTIMAWFRTSAQTGNRQEILTNGTGDTQNDFEFRVRGNNGQVTFRTNNNSKSQGGDFRDGKIHFAAIASSGANGQLRFNIDGVINSISAQDYNLTDQLILHVGARNDGSSAFNGGLDSIKFYDKQLSEAEVEAERALRCGDFLSRDFNDDDFLT